MFLITPQQCVRQNAIDHPDWTVEQHVEKLARCGHRICPLTVASWLKECS